MFAKLSCSLNPRHTLSQRKPDPAHPVAVDATDRKAYGFLGTFPRARVSPRIGNGESVRRERSKSVSLEQDSNSLRGRFAPGCHGAPGRGDAALRPAVAASAWKADAALLRPVCAR